LFISYAIKNFPLRGEAHKKWTFFGREGKMVNTLSELFLNTVDAYPKNDLLLYKDKGRYVAISSEDVRRRVMLFSLGLQSLGLNRGEKLIILSDNRPEWVMADFANLCAGGVTVPIYPSIVPEQIKYIIQDSDAKIVLTSDSTLWEKVAAIKKDLPQVAYYVTFKDEAPEGVLTWREVSARGEKIAKENPELFEKTARSVLPEELASIIYTSGTTGIPKGVMLTHQNFISNIKTLASIVEFNDKDYILSFLPLSHVLERMVTFAFLYKGCSIGYAESVETVAENLLELRPQIMVSVPRLFEKLYAKIMDNVLQSSGLKKKIFFWAVKVGKDYSGKALQRSPIPPWLRFRRKLAHKLVYSKILHKTGGRVRFFVSGGAPLSKDIAEFFYALGLVVLEGYGLTETSPVIAVNTFENLKYGTVGKPIPGVEVKIAADGEILTRGPNVMKGYYKKEEETREAFEGGWFHTGDIGYLDEEGYLVITDRKKDIIITAGGKNIAPQPIENLLKRNAFIANAVVVGGKRKFISALVVPDFEKLEEYARTRDIAFSSRQDLVANSQIIDFMLSVVDKSTPNLAPYEKIKKIALLDRDFELEKEELTPTLKVKRNKVEEKFKDVIDSLYRA
jgi:long-chain acyl-CoA synthetase